MKGQDPLTSIVDEMAVEQLKSGQTIRFVARGRSMWPFILDGDSVSIAPLENAPQLGDVVFLPNEDFGQLHRVIDRCSEGKVCLRGDALPQPDGWISCEEILGILTEQRRNGRSVTVRRGAHVLKIAQILATCRRGMHRMRSFFGFR